MIRRLFPLVLLLSAVWTAACQQSPANDELLPTTVSPALVEPTADVSPPPTTDPGTLPPTVAPIEETAVISATTNPVTADNAANISPSPTLFANAWDDRSIFASGLVASEQLILEALPGATIYHMALTLEADLTVVNGRQEIRYTNQETVPLDYLYFHLFPNLLGGHIDIDNVQVNGQPIATTLESDNSLLRVPLVPPVGPTEQVVVQMDFRTVVPQELGRNYGIFALADDILALAHFYPMVSVYDDEMWNTAQPAEGGDVTYGDTSFFLVRVTAPAEQTVVSSGIVIEEASSNGQQTMTIAAGPMRDFYLATSSRYEVLSETVDGIMVNSFAPPELQNGSELALATAVNSVRGFNGRFTPYPYTELDIVTTSTLALGVEYPGIIANTLRMYDDGSGQPNRNFLESTTAHEVAHQWFYGLVGNDQLDEPWLDESLTQYATWLYYRDQYGEQGAQGFYQALESRWNSTGKAQTPLGLPVGDYSGVAYGSIIYGRGPIFVRELADLVGEETFDRFLERYQQEFRWGIATTADFQRLLEEECGCSVDPLFAENVYGR
ncbi:MAG: M1 family aminopeptidase [Chloroflexota bacterium]